MTMLTSSHCNGQKLSLNDEHMRYIAIVGGIKGRDNVILNLLNCKINIDKTK